MNNKATDTINYSKIIETMIANGASPKESLARAMSDHIKEMIYCNDVAAAPSENLAEYLRLKREMMSLDDNDDPRADDIRDLLDPIWWKLTEEERENLNKRNLNNA